MIGVRFHFEGGFATSYRDSAYPDLWCGLCSYWSPATYSSRDQNTSAFGHSSVGRVRTRCLPNAGAISIYPQSLGGAWNFGTARDRSLDIIRDHRSCNLDGNKCWTLSAWINPSTVGSAMGIIKLGNSGSALQAMALYIAAAGSGMFSAEWAGGNGARTTTGVLTANIWQHVAATKISGTISTTTSLFLNGRPVAISSASANTPNVTFNGTDYIGRFATTGDKFGGYIADVGVWSRAMRPCEIMQLATGASPLQSSRPRRRLYISIPEISSNVLVGKSKKPNLFYSPTPARRPGESIHPRLWRQLKCIWSPSNSKNQTIRDYGPLGFHLAIQGTAILANTESGMAIVMDGTPGCYATSSRAFTTSEYAQLTGNPNMTIAAWVKPDLNHKGCVIKWGDSQTSLAGAALFVNVNNSGVISLETSSNSAYSGTVNNFKGDQWCHLAITKSAGAMNSTTLLYVNGNLVSTSSSSSAATPNITAGGNVEFGRYNTNFTNNPPAINENYKGAIGEAAIWFRVLSPKEIQMLASGISPLQRKAKLPRWAQSKLIPHRVQGFISC